MEPSFFIARSVGADGMAGMTATEAAVLESEGFGGNGELGQKPGAEREATEIQ